MKPFQRTSKPDQPATPKRLDRPQESVIVLRIALTSILAAGAFWSMHEEAYRMGATNRYREMAPDVRAEAAARDAKLCEAPSIKRYIDATIGLCWAAREQVAETELLEKTEQN